MSENGNVDPSANPQPHSPEKGDDLLGVVDSKLTGVPQRQDGTTIKEFSGEFDLGGFSEDDEQDYGKPIEGHPALFTVQRIPVGSKAFGGNVAEVMVRPALPGGIHMGGSREREITFGI